MIIVHLHFFLYLRFRFQHQRMALNSQGSVRSLLTYSELQTNETLSDNQQQTELLEVSAKSSSDTVQINSHALENGNGHHPTPSNSSVRNILLQIAYAKSVSPCLLSKLYPVDSG